MLTFRFTGVNGCMVEKETLTSGMVGKKVKLEFSSDWSDLRKTAVFVAGSVTRDVVNVIDEVEIPPEVLAVPLVQLYVGVYGVSSDGRVTPTIRAMGPIIEPGIDPSGDEGTDPGLPVWAQMLAMIGDLNNLTTEARDNLVEAINEAANVDLSGYVKSVNGKVPDENGNVEIAENDWLIDAAAHGLVEGSENFENNSAVLQTLMEQFAGNFTIQIPAGIYIFTSPVTVPDGITVELTGVSDAFANSMNREKVGTEYHAKANGTTVIYRGEGAMFRHQSCVFKFKNLSLVSQDEDKKYLYTSRLVGQTMVDSATKGKIYAENCLFAGWKTVAGDPYVTDELEAALDGTLAKPETLEQCCIVASRCRFSFCGAAINMGVDSRLNDCSINKCYYGAAFYGSAGFSTLAQCRIEWCIYDGVIAKQAHDVLVTGCEFDRCGHAAVRYVSCTGSSVIGNTMRRNGADSSLTADAATRNTHLYVDGCSGGVISGNTTVRKNISDDGSSTVVRPVNAYNIQSNSGMVISGNNFNGCTTGSYNRYTNNTDCRAVGNLGLDDV